MTENESKTVLEANLDLSLVTGKQTITGTLLHKFDTKTKNPIPDIQITSSPIGFPTCPSVTTKTSSKGTFTTPQVHPLKSNYAVEYQLKLDVPDLSSYNTTVTVGGIGWAPLIEIGNIELFKPSINVKSGVSGFTIRAENNKILPEVNVAIYPGFLQLSMEDEIEYFDVKAVKTMKSDSKGSYNLGEISEGQYTIIFTKEGFIRRIAEVTVVGKLATQVETVALSEPLQEGQIRFVLSWPDAPRDLDFHAMFKVSRWTKCDVYFGKKNCGKTSLDIDNYNYGVNGVETITINKLGRYTYTFAVHKYPKYVVEETKTVPGFNEYVDEDEYSESDGDLLSKETFPDKAVTDSKAMIRVYNSEFLASVFTVNVPTSIVSGDKDKHVWWLAMCMDGKDGIWSIQVMDILSERKPSYKICDKAVKEGY